MNTRRSRPSDINQFLQSLHPVVRRSFLASGGAAYAPTNGEASRGNMFSNAKAASDQAFQNSNPNQGEGGYGGDVNMTGPGRKGMMVPPATNNPGGIPMDSPTRSRFKQPIDAGSFADGRRAQIVGPNMVRVLSADGIGSSTFTTMARGKPIDAHSYLMGKQGFTPSPQYLAQRQAGIESSMGMTKEAAPVVHPGAGGDYLNKGGVETPVENLTPQDRVQAGIPTLADTLTASPAANVVGRYAGKFASGAANLALGTPMKAITNAGRSLYNGFMGGIPAAADYGKDMNDGSAGVSRRQAARIETPTQANPVPKTPTSPEAVTPLENVQFNPPGNIGVNVPPQASSDPVSDRRDLLNDIEGSFYGGGQAPVPTPTPTPQPQRVAVEPLQEDDSYYG